MTGLHTADIQNRIDQTHARGGGRVVLSAGEYVTGTLVLRSGVGLHLEQGARLLGSEDLADYPLRTEPPIRCHADKNGFRSLIYAEEAEDITLTGSGTIDGRGTAFPCGGNDRDGRPRLIQMIGCRGVRIEGLRLRNAGMWLQHYLGCEKLRISGLDAWNHGQPNNDFLDLEGCRDVRVSDCTSDTDDDGITLKSGCAQPCEDIVITNCVVRSHCNAIKLGTESNGGYRNIAISNCVIAPSQNPENLHGFPEGICGIALESVDGGDLNGVTISHITLRGTRSPLFIRLGHRARPFLAESSPPGVGRVRNISLSHIVGTGLGNVGCMVSGIVGHPIENLTLSDIRLEFTGGHLDVRDPGTVPEKEAEYPEATMFGNLPAWGFFFRHVRGISLQNVHLAVETPDARPEILFLDATRVEG